MESLLAWESVERIDNNQFPVRLIEIVSSSSHWPGALPSLFLFLHPKPDNHARLVMFTRKIGSKSDIEKMVFFFCLPYCWLLLSLLFGFVIAK